VGSVGTLLVITSRTVTRSALVRAAAVVIVNLVLPILVGVL
jgi:hypothetical protein